MRSRLAFLPAPVPCSKQKIEGYIANVYQKFFKNHFCITARACFGYFMHKVSSHRQIFQCSGIICTFAEILILCYNCFITRCLCLKFSSVEVHILTMLYLMMKESYVVNLEKFKNKFADMDFIAIFAIN